jgi:hypothetical protein
MEFEQSKPSIQRNVRRFYREIEDGTLNYAGLWMATDNLFRVELEVDEDEWVRNRVAYGDVLPRLGFPSEAQYEKDALAARERVALLPLVHLGAYIEARSQTFDEMSDSLQSHDVGRLVGARDVELWYETAVRGIRRVTRYEHGKVCLHTSYRESALKCTHSDVCPLRVVRTQLLPMQEKVEFTDPEYIIQPHQRMDIVLGKLGVALGTQTIPSWEYEQTKFNYQHQVKDSLGYRI